MIPATSPTPQLPDREAIAQREIGHTMVSPGLARALVAMFLLLIFAVPVGQAVHEYRQYRAGRRATPLPEACRIAGVFGLARDTFAGTPGTLSHRILAADRAVLAEFARYERALEDDSVLGKAVLPRAQQVLVAFGAGNEQVCLGRDGWLFYRPNVACLTAPPFLSPPRQPPGKVASDRHADPLPAILAFHAYLRQRGIALVLLPAPVKAQFHPEKLAPSRYPDAQAPLQNPSFAAFLCRLADAGVPVLDLSDRFTALRQAGTPTHARTDTHWSPAGARAAADELAQWTARSGRLPPRPPAGYTRQPARIVAHPGDIARMLTLPAGHPLLAPEPLEIEPVTDLRGAPWQPDPAADVLVLGDSYCAVYSDPEPDGTRAAGFVEQLACELQRPLDTIVRNAGGAAGTRQALLADLAAGRDRLAGKRLVVWEFAVRELVSGDWAPVDFTRLRAGSTPAPAPAATATAAFEVRATLRARRLPPAPGTVPYRDCLMALTVTNLQPIGNPAPAPPLPAEALVYTWGMRDNVLTSATKLLPGRELTLRLIPWSLVESRYGRLNRTEPQDPEDLLLPVYWAEP